MPARRKPEFLPSQDKSNANKGTDRGRAALKESLQKLKAGRGILLDKNGVAIAGNKTLAMAHELGIEILPVETDGTQLIATVRTDLNLEKDAAARELAWADNRIAQLDLDWDLEALQQSLEDGIELSWLWDEEELDALLDGDEQAEEDQDAVDDLINQAETGQIESRVKLGEIWALGRHRIACGDSTDEGNIKALLGDSLKNVSMIWADPPYGISVVSRGGTNSDSASPGFNKGKVGANHSVSANLYAPIIGDDSTKTAVNAFIVCQFIDAVQIWWGGNFYASNLPDSAHWIVWDKVSDFNQFADAELAWTNQSGALRIFRHQWAGMVKASEQGERRVHPTQKPVALAEWCFEKYGSAKDLIFDPFVGSAPSIIAAQKMAGDRTVFGFELAPAYVEVICQRFETFTGQTAKLIGTL